MSSLTISLEVARSTLLNTQVQMGTVSQNIANADNPAYARQKALLATNPALKTAAGYLGTGARVDQIIQQRDQYVERSLMRSIASQSDYEARATALASVGAQLLDDGDEGISGALGTFWDAWEALSQNPSGLSERTAVTQATTNLASVIRDASSRLADTAADLELEARSEVGTVNGLLERIASLNEAIRLSEGGGQSANDLRDLRYQALTNLAESLPISYQEETNGTLTITIEDASTEITLVSGHEYGELGYDTTEHQLSYTDYQGSTYGDFELSAGRLNGLMTEYRATGTANDLAYVLANPDAPDLTYADRLNAFASMLITEVNGAFGADVFVGTDATDIELDSGFALDPDLDADLALSVAALQENKFDELGSSTFSGYLSSIQQQLGLDEQNAAAQGSFYESLRLQLENQQQSVSGVSLDEELVDLLRLQQVYQAAAKIVQYTSSMMETIMEMV